MQNEDKTPSISSHNTNVFGDKNLLYSKFKRSSDLNISLNTVAKNLIKFKDTLKTAEEKKTISSYIQKILWVI